MRSCRHPDGTCRNSYRPGISSFIGDRGTHVPLTDWSRVMASYAPEFLSLPLIHFLAVVAPGPDFAIPISQSVRHGRRAGIYTALGIGAGISAHVIYTILGIGAFMHASTVLMNAARLIGALYICYLAVNLLRAQPAVAGDPSDIQGKAEHHTHVQSFSLRLFTHAT